MISSNSLLVGYLMGILNMAFFLLAFFMAFEIIRYMKLFEMSVAIVIAACIAFSFIGVVPLSSAIEQFIKDPQHSIGEVVLESIINLLPAQILFIFISMSIWAVVKGSGLDKTKGDIQNKKS